MRRSRVWGSSSTTMSTEVATHARRTRLSTHYSGKLSFSATPYKSWRACLRSDFTVSRCAGYFLPKLTRSFLFFMSASNLSKVKSTFRNCSDFLETPALNKSDMASPLTEHEALLSRPIRKLPRPVDQLKQNKTRQRELCLRRQGPGVAGQINMVIRLVHCPESSRRYFGRLFADSFVALPRNTPGIAASRASLTTKIHPELTTRTSRTVH